MTDTLRAALEKSLAALAPFAFEAGKYQYAPSRTFTPTECATAREAYDLARAALGATVPAPTEPPNHPFYDALEELADEANNMPPDALPGAWQDLALRFAQAVDGVRGEQREAPGEAPSKEWSLEMARREGDLEVGAGPRAPADEFGAVPAGDGAPEPTTCPKCGAPAIRHRDRQDDWPSSVLTDQYRYVAPEPLREIVWSVVCDWDVRDDPTVEDADALMDRLRDALEVYIGARKCG